MHFYKEYLSKLPEMTKCGHLYLALATAKQFRNGQWYRNAPMGINNIGTRIKSICKEAGLTGFFTNHSLRASNATNLYNSGVSEQIIQENTRHHSIEVLCGYKVTSVNQKKHASRILSMQGGSKKEQDKENVQKVQLEISINVKQ